MAFKRLFNKQAVVEEHFDQIRVDIDEQPIQPVNEELEVLKLPGPLSYHQQLALEFLLSIPMTYSHPTDKLHHQLMEAISAQLQHEMTVERVNFVPGSVFRQIQFEKVPIFTDNKVSLRERRMCDGSFNSFFVDGTPQFQLVSRLGCPMSRFSVISTKRTKRPKNRTKQNQKFINLPESIKTRKAESYCQWLNPSAFGGALDYPLYNLYYVDDPEFKTGKSKTVITLPCFMMSIIQYSRPLDLKKELNEHFRMTHANVDPSLKLSQIRSLKSKLMEIGMIHDMEYSSIAMTYVYFEKLALKSMVTKSNRKLFAAVCLLLSAKVNDPNRKYSQLLKVMEDVLQVPMKNILANEFLVYSALEFTLFLPVSEVVPHLERILTFQGFTLDSFEQSLHPFYQGNY